MQKKQNTIQSKSQFNLSHFLFQRYKKQTGAGSHASLAQPVNVEKEEYRYFQNHVN